MARSRGGASIPAEGSLGIPLVSIVEQQKQRSRMDRKSSRTLLAGSGSAGNGSSSSSRQSRFKKSGSRSKLKSSDDELSQQKSMSGNQSNELDGEYDTGWKGAGDDEDDDDEQRALLLEEGRSTQDTTASSRAPSIKDKSTSGSAPSVKGGLPRTVPFNASDKQKARYPANIVRNQKYNVASFVPIVLYEQFKFFFNLYFLLVALSQFVPALRIGFLATYIAPLAFVLAITIGKEAYDDYQRYLRDVAANSTRYRVLDRTALSLPSSASHSHHEATAPLSTLPTKAVASSRLRVGDLVLIEKNQRVPADCVLLRTSDSSGSCFVRTDQLDGETDWKLRVAVERTQGLKNELALLNLDADIYADPPTKDIHTFIGTFTLHNTPENDPSTFNDETGPLVSGLTAENVLWANTVLAAGQAVGFIVYTGRETRAVMNTSHPETKVGLLDLEINRLAKILCVVTFVLSVALVALNGFRGTWYIYVFRFLILFSSIIPISLRVNLDMGKTVYARQIQSDPEIPGTIVRTSTLPEELGRIEYLLSDKTGTLTQNEMELKKLHMGTMSYGLDSMDEVATQLANAMELSAQDVDTVGSPIKLLGTRGRRDLSSRVKDVVLALGLCHNVTPVINDDGTITYQASSPDEVAIVKWTESVGLTLSARERTRMQLTGPAGQTSKFEILEIFPFTSETKRMGIVIRDTSTGDVTFYEKGADVVMARIVQQNDWLEEECGNMAREGLRTLVMARKRLSLEAWKDFEDRYHNAKISLDDRNEAMTQVVSETLEKDLELLGVTGVEDKLQEGVRSTLELLRNAGVKIWMLTGDKIETATCIAISSKLVSRGQYIHQVAKLQTPQSARDELEFIQSKLDCCLVIDGESLQLCIDHFQTEFIEVATKLSAVVACRCSPTQKADVARLIRFHTKKRVCCIGDGGNDVSMIQAADVGLGIVGKEGKQASLAADFSINQFSYLTKLLVWHGRNSYKRSAKLAQFVIHRGLIISIIQAVFSSVFYFAPIAIFQGWLLVGYSTIYTCLPVFSLVLDRDVNEDLAVLYPELYKDLVKGRSLSYKTFFEWLMISVYQGGAIMMMSLFLFENEFLNVVAISFTALVFNELIMVALEISTWHIYMVIAEVVTFMVYIVSMVFLPEYFDLSFVFSTRFVGKTLLIVAVSSFPLYMITAVKHRLAPASYAKLRA